MTAGNTENNAFDLELFFELSPDLLCVAGYDGYFKKVNSMVLKVLGYTREELFSKPISHFIHPDDRLITERYRNSLRKNQPLVCFDNRYITKSGEIVWLVWTSMPIDAENVVFAIAKNITHKKKLEQDRDLLLAKFTRVNNELKQLTYTTSHDLRAPVSNLLSVFDVLDVSKIQDKETVEFVDMLRQATASLKVTLDKYVESLNQQDSLNVHVETLDVSMCLTCVLQSLSSLIKTSKVKLVTDFTAWSSVQFNQMYLESILLNLLTNSIKYRQPDVYPVITITTQIENGVKKLTFTDNGLGFDMEATKHKIFGLNQRFHDNADSKGIGLYLVHNQVTSLGGQIDVESEINKGTKFTITFDD